ncbi:hypothetical protein BC835DRAFT_865925 [Cytidiella melzeri]|nr:hypothetical protein BC835DRAFT_865925 [Cytidiella melzeri]
MARLRRTIEFSRPRRKKKDRLHRSRSFFQLDVKRAYICMLFCSVRSFRAWDPNLKRTSCKHLGSRILLEIVRKLLTSHKKKRKAKRKEKDEALTCSYDLHHTRERIIQALDKNTQNTVGRVLYRSPSKPGFAWLSPKGMRKRDGTGCMTQ